MNALRVISRLAYMPVVVDLLRYRDTRLFPMPALMNKVHFMQRLGKLSIRRQPMARYAHMVVHFMDGTKIVFRRRKDEGLDTATIAANVKKALDKDKIVVEADGSLIVIPVRNIKYIQVTPSPDALPAGVMRNVEIVE